MVKRPRGGTTARLRPRDDAQRKTQTSDSILPRRPSPEAYVETVFKPLKAELIGRTIFLSRSAAKISIGRYIDGFYNPVRRHSALGYKSPCDFEAAA
jgi:transposase InsO family protein